MAAIDVISKAGFELEDAVLELTNFIEVCQSLDGDNPPPWLSFVGFRVSAIHATSQAYQLAVHQHALPHLRDLANASKPRGGMGGTPMSTQRDEQAHSGAFGVAGVSGANSFGVAPAGAGSPILNLRK